MKVNSLGISTLCSCILALNATGQTYIEDFEYASDADMLAKWTQSSTVLSLSTNVALASTGTNSLRVDTTFFEALWETRVIEGPTLAEPISVQPNQYITVRIAGHPGFTNSTYKQFFVYAYDVDGNFGRWGTSVPVTTNWYIANIPADSIAKPWDSPQLPDLSKLNRFSLFIYGQGDPSGPQFDATFYVDDIMIRDTPLVEFPPASPMRALIDNFESYANTDAMKAFYNIVNSPATTSTAIDLDSSATKSLKLSIDFAAGQYPWGAALSQVVAPFSFPSNAAVQFRFKGDPALAAEVDEGTTFWLSFYDENDNAYHFTLGGSEVTNANWTTVNAGYQDFWTTASVDTGNIVRWRALVQARTGTPESTPVSGTFYVDDINIVLPPSLTVIKDGQSWQLKMDNLVSGKTYTVHQSTDLSQWNNATTIQAAGTSATWTLPAGQTRFFRVSYNP